MISVADIKLAVSTHFELAPIEMVSRRRNRRVARPRQIAMTLTRDFTPLSYPEIGREFGNRDHSTVMHALKVVDRLCRDDSAFAADVAEIRDGLATGLAA